MDSIEQRINRRLYLVFIFSLLMNGLFTYLYFFKDSGKTDSGQYALEIARGKALLKATQVAYQKQQLIYRQRVDSLTKKLETQKVSMKESKKRTVSIKTRMQEISKGISAQELLDRAAQLKITQTLNDAGAELESKDSLLDSQEDIYENLIAEKDNMIATCDTAFHALEEELQNQIQVNERLNKELKKKERKEKRRRVFNRILGVGVLIIGGVFLIGS